MDKTKYRIERCDLSGVSTSELKTIAQFAHVVGEAIAIDSWTGTEFLADVERAIGAEFASIGEVLSRIEKRVAKELGTRDSNDQSTVFFFKYAD
jgi:hypothetical protein